MKSSNQKQWSIISFLALVIPLIAYLVIDFLYSGDESKVQIYGVLAGIIASCTFIALLICVFAVYKLKGKIKLIPIVGVLLLLVILSLSSFTAIFSGFAGSH